MKFATIINLLFPGEFEINYRYVKIFHLPIPSEEILTNARTFENIGYSIECWAKKIPFK